MPLISGKAAKTKKGFSRNVETEIAAGAPKNQAIAIAYAKAGKERRKKK